MNRIDKIASKIAASVDISDWTEQAGNVASSLESLAMDLKDEESGDSILRWINRWKQEGVASFAFLHAYSAGDFTHKKAEEIISLLSDLQSKRAEIGKKFENISKEIQKEVSKLEEINERT